MQIAVEQVSFSYPGGVEALRGVSLTIEAGEAVAIVGENGAGKTTLARHLNGLLKPTSGRVLVGDWDTAEQSIAQMSRRVGLVFQNPDDQLFERTVRAEVTFGPRNLGWQPAEVREAVDEALARVGLSEAADTHPYDLHLAQRKLVALAATLAMHTPVVLLDEPTTGQDAVSVERIGTIVDRLHAEGRTVIAISHDLDFCAEHFERAVVMAEGRVLADGPTRQVFTRGEVLAHAAVEAPQLIRLATALGWEAAPLTVEEFLARLRELRRSR
ncbi:MAG: ABC transporter ATP-binding protein [Chloroflexota bacterium]